MKSYWLPLSLFGALIYGSFSLLLELISPKIKSSESAQFGYGLILAVIQIPIVIIAYSLWHYYNPKDSKILIKNLDWRIITATILVGFLIGPVHTLVINAGGSVGQQTMYSLAILPVLIGGWVLMKERLTKKQWVGIGCAALGAYLMSTGKDKSDSSEAFISTL
jgi:drug/metabolite transporter (DMT)-like permease